jgi:uncharacterized protein
MLILTSPSKTQIDHGREYPGCSQPLLANKSQEIIALLKKMGKAELSRLLGTGEQLTETSYRRIQALSAKPTLQNGCQAIFTFQCEVYRAIDAKHYGDEDLDFAQRHLLILSALYGVLRPLDLIQPHRLEMANKLTVGDGNDLYAFWRKAITETVNGLLAKEKAKHLINLASGEYARAIDRHSLSAPMITITFKERVAGGYRAIPIYSKRARGAMVHYIIIRRIRELVQLRDFAQDGYLLDREGSNDKEWIFLRN